MAPTTKQREFIDIARSEFVEFGYGGASIRSIAKRAEMSLSALYYHYASKQELLVAILDDGLETFLMMCRTELDCSDSSAQSKLRAMVTAFVKFRTLHQEQSQLVQTEVRSLEPANLESYEARQHEPLHTLQKIIDDGVRDGSFHTENPTDARRAIAAMCNAIAHWYRPDGGTTVDELVQRYTDLALVIVEAMPTPDISDIRKSVE
ncbi:TetR/AcrR family transcriptional regulator [Rhodococcus sp. H29-C3]|uniref:TetR/AcrR family transcriptional regulator n=1 Tax=Rhodococcus sp. H29-C3 TaxID=3046307 RepID=UPI0024B9A75A|nr:TetR/AcrR family transcriptional regulator [Rhodococcus sp. H29-C3]MDJ0359772.1 TetR/AcrR family transcriptional regulator [Rhodococcus sp. H29-C3]